MENDKDQNLKDNDFLDVLEQVKKMNPSEGVFTKQVFLANFKNVLFFFLMGMIIGLMVKYLGGFGKWVAILYMMLLCFLSYEPIKAFALNLMLLITAPFVLPRNGLLKLIGWKSIQLLISLTTILSFFAIIIYLSTRINNVSFFYGLNALHDWLISVYGQFTGSES